MNCLKNSIYNVNFIVIYIIMNILFVNYSKSVNSGLVFLSNQAIACELPSGGMTYSANEIENKSFQLDRKLVTEQVVDKVITTVNICKSEVEIEIKKIKQQISQLIEQKSVLEGSTNINDIIRRKETLLLEKESIQKSFQKDIENHDLKGMFAVIVESSDPFTNADTLISAGRHFMGVKAVRTIIGQLLKSKSYLMNNELTSHISIQSSGLFKIDTELLRETSQFFHNKTQYVCSAIIKVSPLKQKAKQVLRTFSTNIKNCCTVDLLSDNWQQVFYEHLNDHTNDRYSKAVMDKLIGSSNQWKNLIKSYNSQALQNVEQKKQQLKRYIEIKNNEILKASMDIDKARNILNKIYKKLDISNSKTPEKQLMLAISQANEKVNVLSNKIISIMRKSMEIRQELVQTTRDPIHEIRQKVIALYFLMKETHSKQETIIENSIVNNGYLIKNEKKQNLNVTKIPEKIYVFPYTKSGKIYVLIVMQFSMLNMTNIGESGSADLVGSSAKFNQTKIKRIDGTLPEMRFVYIPSGSFKMGSPTNEYGRDSDEKLHWVTITKSFYIQTTEVTQKQWKHVILIDHALYTEYGDSYPIINVSWYDIQKFIEKLNNMSKSLKYRLPTEAEWEYSARIGTFTAFSNGGIVETGCGLDPNLDKIGWYCGNTQKLQKVAQKNSNKFGLYDMHGNVWEWCQNYYGSYTREIIVNPVGPISGKERVIRGGSWTSYSRDCRSSRRSKRLPSKKHDNIGFRLVAEKRIN